MTKGTTSLKTFLNKRVTGGETLLLFVLLIIGSCRVPDKSARYPGERISINDSWKFLKYGPSDSVDSLVYDLRPEVKDINDDRVADSKPTEALEATSDRSVLRPWILPTANPFIKNPARHHIRPDGNRGTDFPFVQTDFDDRSWETVTIPHDWGIRGPFQEGWESEVGGGMGRLASHGVAWYRRKLDIPPSDKGKSIFLDIDGAMSYAMVWINGTLAGGWPYGYNSFRINLTPYIKAGGENQLAIRIDNPPHSARWYPGGGLYRNVWLVKKEPLHVAQYGVFITSRNISEAEATLDISVTIDNDSERDQNVEVVTTIYAFDHDINNSRALASFDKRKLNIRAASNGFTQATLPLKNPALWGPPPTQKPSLYKAVTVVYAEGKPVDQEITRFGIRSVDFNPDKGILINGEHIPIRGVNQHHDLGALGAAFNLRAAERQLELLQEMGCNAIRMSHNPPAPELLELTDKMGFLVVNEIFDVWERKKTPLDFHLIFNDWYEPDTRSFIRRDRNAPSVILWSVGNEVGEQYTEEQGADLGRKLALIAKEEDPSRPVTSAMNYAKPPMPFSQIWDVISLNYQGEGIRDAEAYASLKGITTSPQYPAFHQKFPEKVILSSETASALSTRGTYLFPVHQGISAPVEDGSGGDPGTKQVSAYELYTAAFGSSADKVFASLDRHPYVAGEFVWTGWDYLGEPTPYYLSRSSYSGIIDLAGFKKDRFYLYQSRWRPDLPVAHLLPHWNWPERTGMITPVHVFTSGDAAELFLNGKSLGMKCKRPYEYRIRYDSVIYAPGELKVVTFREGKPWAEDVVKTTGPPDRLEASADRTSIRADGTDLSFVTVQISDSEGIPVPDANDRIIFSLEGPGEIIATDNGYPADLVAFGSRERNAFGGKVLAIIRSVKGVPGIIQLTVRSNGLKNSTVKINSQ